MAKNKKNILPDLRSVIYQISAQTGNKAHFDSIIKKYNIETLSEEKNRLGRALGQFKDPKLLNQALNFAMSRHVRIQDTAQIFASVWANPVGSTIAWNYTKTHWRELLKRYPSSGHMLNKFIKPAAVFTGAKLAQEIKQFFSTHRAPGAKRAVEQVLEKVVSNSEWLKRDQQKISLWLNKK